MTPLLNAVCTFINLVTIPTDAQALVLIVSIPQALKSHHVCDERVILGEQEVFEAGKEQREYKSRDAYPSGVPFGIYSLLGCVSNG